MNVPARLPLSGFHVRGSVRSTIFIFDPPLISLSFWENWICECFEPWNWKASIEAILYFCLCSFLSSFACWALTILCIVLNVSFFFFFQGIVELETKYGTIRIKVTVCALRCLKEIHCLGGTNFLFCHLFAKENKFYRITSPEDVDVKEKVSSLGRIWVSFSNCLGSFWKRKMYRFPDLQGEVEILFLKWMFQLLYVVFLFH